MTEIFEFKDHSSDLRKNNYIERKIIKSCKYDSETITSLGAKLWDILPENIKEESLKDFKKPIRVFIIFYLCQNSTRLIPRLEL